MVKKGSYIKHGLVIGGGAIINFLVGLITTPLITRLINPEQYGEMSIFTTYTSIISLVLTFGLDQALVRFFYQNENNIYKRKLLTRCWIYPFLLCVIISIIGAIIFYFIDKSFVKGNIDTIILFLLNVYVLFMNRYAMLILRLEQKSNMYSVATIAHKALYVLIIIIWVPFSNFDHFKIMAIAALLSYGITSFFAIIICRKIWKPCFVRLQSEENYSGLIKYGIPLMISSGIYLFFQAIDRISLQFFCSYAEIGIYSSAMSLMSLIAIIRTAFTTVWTPATVEHYEKDPNDRGFYQKGNLYITVVMLVMGFTLIFCKDLIVLFLGEKYRGASVLLPFLLFQPIMYTISETTVVGIYFKKKSFAHVIIALFACIFNLLGNFILIPYLGPKGAAISTGIAYILFFTLRTVFSNKYYYTDYKLSRFYCAVILLVLFALYNTFFSFGILSIMFYIIAIVCIVFLYRKTISDLCKLGLNLIRKIKKEEKE